PRDYVSVRTPGVSLADKRRWNLFTIYTERSIEPVFVQESAQKLTESLQKEGRYLAVTKPAVRLDAPPAGVMNVDPGPKYSLSSIDFENAAPLDEHELRDSLALKPRALFSRGVYTSEIATADLERVRNAYVRRGYVDARVSFRLEPKADQVHG